MLRKAIKNILLVILCSAFSIHTSVYAQHVVPPRGFLGMADCTQATGWSCITGDPQYVSIHLYHDVISAATLITVLPASQARNEPGFLVNSGCTDINHGFTKTWSQAFIDNISDGNSHNIYAVAVDNNNAGNRTTLTPQGGFPIPACNVTPWMQTTGGDVRNDHGILDDMSPFAACGGPYVSLQGSGGSPGVVLSGSRTPDFGTRGGKASVNNWAVGSPNYPDRISNVTGPLHTSYASALANAKANGNVITLVNNASYGVDLTYVSLFNPGVYLVNGDLHVNAVETVNPNSSIVFFVTGKTTFTSGAKMRVPVGSFFSIITKGDLIFDPSVGSAAACPPAAPATADVEGLYSTDGNILIQGNNGGNSSCAVPDNSLAVQGALVANAGRGGGTIQNTRNLCGSNAQFPSFSVRERPDLMLTIPAALKFQTSVSQETTPGQ